MRILFIFLLLLLSQQGMALDCSGGDITLSTQSDIDNFQSTYGNCDRVTGYLNINSNDALSNLDGLANLTSVGDFLYISDNTALTNLDGLANLTSVGNHLTIEGNDALSNLDGLANLTSVGGYLNIGGNDALTNLDGLANVTSVGDYLEIWYNERLTNLDGLANVTSVGGYLDINSNRVLTNLDGLANLTSVGGWLAIRSNDALTNLDGLANLTSVGGNLDLADNPALTNLDGLANLTSVGGYLSIEGNDVLSNCRGVAPVLGWVIGSSENNVVGDIYIRGNKAGCNSVSEILAPYTGIDLQMLSATSCKAADPANSIKLQSRESGLTNTETETNISVACPLNREAFTSGASKTNVAFSITMNAQKSTDDTTAMSCNLSEYVGDTLSDSEAVSISLTGTTLASASWNNWPTNNLTNYTITCDLPPQTAITSIETRAIY